MVYLRGHEGRGIGLGHKIRAYALQEDGRDTVDANLELGLPVDSREYGIGAQILVDLGVTTMRLMTNNPVKYGGLEGFGLNIVERVALESLPTEFNIDYLRTKRERMGHFLEGLDETQLNDRSSTRTIAEELRARVGEYLEGAHDGRGLRVGIACAVSTAASRRDYSTGALDTSSRRRGRPVGRRDRLGARRL